MMMTLGFFVFDLRTTPYDQAQRQTAWRLPSQSPINHRPVYQFLGPDEDTLTLSGSVYTEITGGRVSLDLIRVMAEQGKAWPLIEGSGRMYGLSATKSRSFHNTTLGKIVEQIAKEHSIIPHISDGLSGIRINHIDQTGESDISLLSRLGDKFNAVVSVKHGRLLFLTFGKGVSISGKELPAVKIRIEECASFNYRKQSRDAYTGVVVYWNNVKGAKRQKITLGTSEHAKELKQTFVSEHEALEAARSELERLERATESLTLTLTEGRAEIEAEAPLKLEGFKPEIQGIQWAIASVTHSLGDNGFTTHISAEPMPHIKT